MNNLIDGVWVFIGAKASFPSGVFLNKEIAEFSISKYKLTGLLTFYPINILIYDWVQENNLYKNLGNKEITPEYIQKFSSASQMHHHYEDGIMLV